MSDDRDSGQRPAEPADAGAGRSAQALIVLLPPDLASVGRARQAVRDALREWGGDAELVDDATLVASELVTNGVLHAATDLTLVLSPAATGIRMEVRDASARPVLAPLTAPPPAEGLLDDPQEVADLEALVAEESMTGRGMGLVDALADTWGVEPFGDGGKTVWVEVGTGRPAAAPHRLDHQRRGSRPGIRLAQLVAVPVRLLVESDRQFDDLLRELQVLVMPGNPAVDPPLVELARRANQLSDHVGSLRESGRTQSREAVARGDRLMDLTVIAPPDAMDALEAVDVVLTEAAHAARDGRLLTLPPSREIIAFRQWYRDEVTAQLSGRPPRPCPLPVSSPDVVRRRRRQQLDDARNRELASLAAQLEEADDEEAVAGIVLRRAVDLLGGRRAAVILVEPDNRTATMGASLGFSDQVASAWERFSVTDDLPASEAIRTGRTVVTRTLAERAMRYPLLDSGPVEPDPLMVCTPITADQQTIGALVMGFERSRDVHDDEVTFCELLGAVVGGAYQRVRVQRADAVAQAQRRLVAEVEALLQTAPDRVAALGDVLRRAVSDFGGWCSIHVDDGTGTPRFVAAASADPEKVPLIEELHRRWPPRPGTPIADCLATGHPQVIPVVPLDLLAERAEDHEHLAVVRQLHVGMAALVPIKRPDGTVIGVLGVATESGRSVTETSIAAAGQLADSIGAALAER